MTKGLDYYDAPPAKSTAAMRLYVCTTCKETSAGDEADQSGDEKLRAGAKLHAALLAEPNDPAIEIVPIECLSVCTRSCAVSFAARGKWTYIYGGLVSGEAAPVLIEGAKLYLQAEDGLIPWKLRPAVLKKGVIARVPPLPEVP